MTEVVNAAPVLASLCALVAFVIVLVGVVAR
jgi:hypothetical protein